MVSQHLGGIHSGCALSGIGWLVLKVVNNFRHHKINPDLILVIGTITNVAVIFGALSALPWIRNNHHK
jgi:anaerobic C4-dicarboxylate transporter